MRAREGAREGGREGGGEQTQCIRCALVGLPVREPIAAPHISQLGQRTKQDQGRGKANVPAARDLLRVHYDPHRHQMEGEISQGLFLTTDYKIRDHKGLRETKKEKYVRSGGEVGRRSWEVRRGRAARVGRVIFWQVLFRDKQAIISSLAIEVGPHTPSPSPGEHLLSLSPLI